MKKLLTFLNIVFICSFITVFSLNLSTPDSNSNADKCIPQQTEVEGTTVLDNYISKDVVYEDEIVFSKRYSATFTMPIERLDVSFGNLKTGDILRKDNSIGDFVIPYNLRIREIGDDYMIVDNLDETEVKIDFMLSNGVHGLEDLSIDIIYYGSSLNIYNYEYYFDNTLGQYVLDMMVTYNNDMLNGSKCSVYVNYYNYIDGLFVDNSYVYNDQLGYYVYKVINVGGIEYYQKKYVTILGTESYFDKIEGDINGKNVIVKL